MGQSASRAPCQIEGETNADREISLNIAVNDFYNKHCEFGFGMYVERIAMQSALFVYLDMVGLTDTRLRWNDEKTKTLHKYNILEYFSRSVNEKHGLFTSGVIGYRVLVGVRIKSWPQVKQT